MGSSPAIGLRVTLDGVETTEQRIKVAKAEVRQIKKDLQDAVKTGGDVERQFKRLNEAYAKVDQLRAGRGGSPSGLSRGGGGMSFNTTQTARGGNFGGGIRGGINDARDVGGIASGLSQGGAAGAAEALRSASGLARGKGGFIGGAATPLALLAFAANEYDAGMKGIERSSKAKYSAFESLRALEDFNGDRATMKKSEKLQGGYKREAVQGLGAFDNFVQDSRLFNTSVAGFSLKGVTDAIGVTSRIEDIDEKAEAKFKEESAKLIAHTEAAYKAAGMGDLARAQREQEASVADMSPAGRAEAYKVMVAQGTPGEQYLRAQNVKRFNAEYTQLHNKRGSLRTGD